MATRPAIGHVVELNVKPPAEIWWLKIPYRNSLGIAKTETFYKFNATLKTDHPPFGIHDPEREHDDEDDDGGERIWVWYTTKDFESEYPGILKNPEVPVDLDQTLVESRAENFTFTVSNKWYSIGRSNAVELLSDPWYGLVSPGAPSVMFQGRFWCPREDKFLAACGRSTQSTDYTILHEKLSTKLAPQKEKKEVGEKEKEKEKK